MTPSITKDTLQSLENRLFSGDLAEVSTAISIIEAEEIALGDLMEDAHQLAAALWPQSGLSLAEQLVRLAQITALQIVRTQDAELVEDHEVLKIADWSSLPVDWGSLLPNLQQLQITGGQIETLPNTLGDLEKLTSLKLTNVFFQHFPPAFPRLLALRALIIVHEPAACSVDAPYFSLPDEFSLLESLEELYIESCLFNCIPEQMQLLPSLCKLHINCDLEALTPDFPTYKRLKQRVTPDVLHFVPKTLNAMPRLEELTLLLPARHFPLSEQLFQNSHLRKLKLSSRLVAQLPLHSNELSRIEKIEVFKPNILQHLKLVFSLPEAEIEPVQHAYRSSHVLYNLWLTLFWLPVGPWYLTQELVVYPLLQPNEKLGNQLLRFCLSLLIYPIAFFVFTVAIFYFGMRRLFAKHNHQSKNQEATD